LFESLAKSYKQGYCEGLMREPGSYRFWEVRRPYGVAVRVGLVTAGVILIGKPDLAYVPFSGGIRHTAGM